MSKEIYNLIATNAAFRNPVKDDINQCIDTLSVIDDSDLLPSSWDAANRTASYSALGSLVSFLGTFLVHTNTISGVETGDDDLRKVISIAANASDMSSLLGINEDYSNPDNYIRSLTDGSSGLDKALALGNPSAYDGNEYASRVSEVERSLRDLMNSDRETIQRAEEFLEEASTSQVVSPFVRYDGIKKILLRVSTNRMRIAIENDTGPVVTPNIPGSGPGAESNGNGSTTNGNSGAAKNIFVLDKGGYFQASDLETVLQEIGAAVLPYFGGVTKRLDSIDQNITAVNKYNREVESKLEETNDRIVVQNRRTEELSSELENTRDTSGQNLLPGDSQSESSASAGWVKGPYDILIEDVGLTTLDKVSARANVRTDEESGIGVFLRMIFLNEDNVELGFNDSNDVYYGTESIAQKIENVEILQGTKVIRFGVRVNGSSDSELAYASLLCLNKGTYSVPFSVPSASANIVNEALTRIEKNEQGVESIAQVSEETRTSLNEIEADVQSKNSTFTSPEQPTAKSIGDTWYDTDDGFREYRWNGGSWVDVSDARFGTLDEQIRSNANDLSEAIKSINEIDNLVDQKITTYFTEQRPSPETYDLIIGDLWYDSDADNKLYRWDGSDWKNVDNKNIELALDRVATAQAIADRKIQSFVSSSKPVIGQNGVEDIGEGDLWLDTSDSNKLYRYNGTEWILFRDTGIADAIDAASDAQATADGKVTTFFESEDPVTLGNETSVGDLWFDLSSKNTLYRRNADNTTWTKVDNEDIANALSSANDAQATADGKIQSYFSDSAPTDADAAGESLSIGDLWFDTDDGNRQHRWNGTQWINIQDTDIARAIEEARRIESIANTKTETFFSSSAPSDAQTNDLWINTSEGNKLYRYNGNKWIEIQDQQIAEAIGRAAEAKATADGKIQTFYTDEKPVSGNATGDLWIDSNDDNHPYYWNGSEWVSIRDGAIAVSSSSANDALNKAQEALTAAQKAQATADGAISAFYQPEEPVNADIGDLWFDTDDNQAYRYDGTNWLIIEDNMVSKALAAAQNAQTTADGKITAYYTAGEPTDTDPKTGDLWYDQTNNNNTPYYWDGDSWVNIQDADIAIAQADAQKAITDAFNAQVTADGKITTFYTSETPQDPKQGDLWINEGNGNLLSRYNGSAWVEIQDRQIQKALVDASNAQTTADGKIESYYADEMPSEGSNGDLWFDTNDDNTPYRHNGTEWIRVKDGTIQTALEDAARAADDASKAQATADSKITTYYTSTEPSSPSVGDLWLNSSNDNRLYRYDGSNWIEIRDQGIVQAIRDADTAQATADGKITAYQQDTPPSDADIGDIWYDTDDNNHVRYWNGNQWVSIRDRKIDEIEAIADSKIQTFFQGNQPSATSVGDIWIDTSNGNHIYRWNGSDWVDAQDSQIGRAIQNASRAQDTADGKVTTFYTTSAPTAEGLGDLWFDLSNKNKVRRWNGSSWVDVADKDIANALQRAADAQTTADEKIATYTQPSAPNGKTIGDIWYDSDDNNRMYRYDGSNWVEIADGRIDANSETIDKIDNRTTQLENGARTQASRTESISSSLSTTQANVQRDKAIDLVSPPGSEPSAATKQKYNEIDIEETRKQLNNFSDEVTDSIGDIQNQVDGKVETYFGSYVPSRNNAPYNTWAGDFSKHDGDLFFNRDTGIAYQFDATQNNWVELRDKGVETALNNASRAQDTADGKRTIFYNQPTTPYQQGDMWRASTSELRIASRDRTKNENFSNGDWIRVSDITAENVAKQVAGQGALATKNSADWGTQVTGNGKPSDNADVTSENTSKDTVSVNGRSSSQVTTDIDNAKATADKKITTFVQSGTPTAISVGDLWVNTGNKNILSRWSGSSWVTVRDTDISNALTTATAANNTANKKIQSFYQTDAPSSTGRVTGDLWFDTDDANQPYYWDGSKWISVRDKTIAAASQSASDANTRANNALTAAQQAQATADGAIRTYYQSEAPTGLNSTTDVGDLWFDTNDGQAYRWNGSQFIVIEDNSIGKALAAAQNAQSTADGKITAYYSNTQPSSGKTGDLWYDTGDNNKPYYWDGSKWVSVRDATIAVAQGAANDAIADAETAQGTASRAQASADSGKRETENLKKQAQQDSAINLVSPPGSEPSAATKQKYNEIDIEQTRKNLEDFSNEITESVGDVQDQVDGKVETYFGSYNPTNNNEPYTTWSDKFIHNGDLFYNTDTGVAYRFDVSVNAWSSLRDKGVTEALDDASRAQDTADGKRTVFYSLPKTPYQQGDLWRETASSLKIATQDRPKTESFSSSDWILVSDITGENIAKDTSAVNGRPSTQVTSGIDRAQDTADEKIKTFFQDSSPTASTVGDMWVKTNDNNKLYRWNGSAWQLVADQRIDANSENIEANRTYSEQIDGRVSTGATSSRVLTSSIGVVADLFADGNMFFEDNIAYKKSGGDSWNSQIYSTIAYGAGARAHGVVLSDNSYVRCMIGLNSDPQANASYDTIDYAIFIRENNDIGIYEDGDNRGVSFAKYQRGDIVDVVYDGQNINYLHNGSLLRSVNVGEGKQYYFDSSFHYQDEDRKMGITFTQGDYNTVSQLQSTVDGLAGQWGVEINSNGQVVGLVRLDAKDGRTNFEVVADNFRVVSNQFNQQLFQVSNDGIFFLDNLIVDYDEVRGKVTSPDFRYGAKVYENARTSTFQIFDGANSSQWVEAIRLQASVRNSGNRVSFEYSANMIFDKISNQNWQAGPGGPPITIRIRNLTTNRTVWESEAIAASAIGGITLSNSGKIDSDPAVGTNTYAIETKWEKGTYSVGRVDVRFQDLGTGNTYYSITSTDGVYWASYTNPNWRIRVDNLSDEFASLNTESISNQTAIRINPITGELAGWPAGGDTRELTTNSTYLMQNDDHSMMVRINSIWFRATEFSGV